MKSPQIHRRASGVLAHLTSLPGPHGSGDLGGSARRFVDFLSASSQRFWQMLPVGPPGYGESPYSAQSTFAGSPLLIGLDDLAADGLLDDASLAPPTPLDDGRMDFVPMEAHRLARLHEAFERFRAGREGLVGAAPFAAFAAENESWLEDFALFRALKRAHGGGAWTGWERDVRARQPTALAAARRELADEIAFEKFAQYVFDLQWSRLREYASERGVALIGDVPIFVAHDSADVWQNPRDFFLDDDGEPSFVAGVPPDYFSRTGQRWGNPLYRWRRMEKNGYAWWIARLRSTLRRFDMVRLDHFIGFHRYWRIPASEPTAMHGRWMRGPGRKLFDRAQAALGSLPLIAEDLGEATRGVYALRDRYGFPGIKVLQFAFGDDPAAPTFLPHNYERRAVVFTGTHDNDTTVGWFTDPGGQGSRTPAQTEEERHTTLRYLGTSGKEIHWEMIRAALASVAGLALMPLQDVLGKGSEARMNRPGLASGNWTWRVRENELSADVAARLRDLTETYDRGAPASPRKSQP
ncbi:MAG TPA: 4-alpha-glucanotransferase [Polyangiaceae bacterium]|jgi:4-alpha-glucanotransferase|nr:4-alpha-glucanotransferase [Polyangiaceae bacterium]